MFLIQNENKINSETKTKDLYNNKAICFIKNLSLSIINCMVISLNNHYRFLSKRQALIFEMLYGNIKCNRDRTLFSSAEYGRERMLRSISITTIK